MAKLMAYKVENRWAIVANILPGRSVFLGKYCHRNATVEEPVIKTFSTRKKAREARKTASYFSESRVVKVRVTYEEIGRG